MYIKRFSSLLERSVAIAEARIMKVLKENMKEISITVIKTAVVEQAASLEDLDISKVFYIEN